MTAKTVFISYSQESAEHSDRVLALAEQLRKDGYDCLLDQYVTDPAEGWTQWMSNGLATADFVLLVYTQIYAARFKGEEAKGLGKGVKWEAREVRNYIYGDNSKGARFLPVVFEHADADHIVNVQKDATYYEVGTPAGYELLLRRLGEQHQAIKPPIGKTREFDYSKLKRKVDLTGLPVTTTKLFGRENELKMLHDAWFEPKTRVISFIAWGGVGKSSLINTWLKQMDDRDFCGAERVFGHSFYSQGTSDQRQVSAEHFINEAFDFLNFDGEIPKSPNKKGKLLAELFSECKTLLILDGLEPMQYPPGVMKGALKDESLKVLLKSLVHNMDGLCVITSRVPVLELVIDHHSLDNLSIRSGVELIESLGINGLTKSKAQAVIDVDGHALTLTLMANYLATVHDGDVDKRDLIGQFAEEEEQGEHAKTVMKSYEGWLAQSDKPDLNILYLMSLFDRPADIGAVDALLVDDPIPGITDKLQNLTDSQWAFALKRLHGLQLIAAESKANLDCHPLVREYFAEQLKAQNPESYKIAHTRLYEYYKALPEKELPDTLEEMQPLFTAVAHGCLAGLHQQAMDEVYWPRVLREGQHYVNKKLGAFSSDLACVACFFECCWDKPAEGLTEDDKAFTLNFAAFGLRGLGRLQEAVVPFVASVKLFQEQKKLGSSCCQCQQCKRTVFNLGSIGQCRSICRAKCSVDRPNR